MRFQLRAQDYRGADSVIMTEEQKPDKAVDGEVVVYAALLRDSICSIRRSKAPVVDSEEVQKTQRFNT